MNRVRFFAALLAFLMIPTIVLAAHFAVYPGAKIDASLSSQATQASQGHNVVTVYVAPAKFATVVAFYKAKYKEQKSMEGRPSAASQGAVFIFSSDAGALMPTRWLTIKPYGASTLIYDAEPAH